MLLERVRTGGLPACLCCVPQPVVRLHEENDVPIMGVAGSGALLFETEEATE